jgi:WD40 repeat protein
MSLDERARTASDDLLRTTRPPDIAAMLDDLKRRRRRGAITRIAGTVGAVAVVLGGWAVLQGGHPSPPPPATATRVSNGALVTVHARDAFAVDGTVDHLPTDALPFAELQFSSDGSELIYSAQGGRIVAKNVNDGGERVLTTCASVPEDRCGFALSPDERQLVLVTWSRAEATLEILHLASGASEVIKEVTGLGNPAWSPDGERVAYIDADGLRVMASDGSRDRRIVEFEPETSAGYGRPSWSPDGSHLSVLSGEQVALPPDVTEKSGFDSVTRYSLLVVEVDTGEITDLGEVGTCICLGVTAPHQAWSPDGQWIAVSTVDSNKVMRDPATVRTGGVYLVRPDGSDRRLLSDAEVANLAWQPLTIGSEPKPAGTSP